MRARPGPGAAFALLVAMAAILPSGCAREARPNVLLISLDTLRADRLSTWGYERDTSPFLTELASRGTRFANASVNAQGTAPSHTTILSGLYQQTHDVGMDRRMDARFVRISPEVRMIQEHLRGAGYATVGVTDGGWLIASIGFERGFDAFSDRGGGIHSGTRRMLEMIDALPDDRPVFAFYHTDEIHSPYATPEPDASRYGRYESTFDPTSERLKAVNRGELELDDSDRRWIESAYDAGIRYTDERLRVFFDELEARGFLDDAIIVITSDHGEELGDRGRYLHNGYHHRELMHVPLLFIGDGIPEGVVDDRLASSIDITPTLLALTGFEVPPDLPGQVLFGADAAWEDRSVLAQTNTRRWALRTRRWKLLVNEFPRWQSTLLYDLENDPLERVDVADRHPDVVARLERELAERRAALPRRAATGGREIRLDDEQQARLRALGYLDEAGDEAGDAASEEATPR
jgi:arylsulfatase A-like enzyme